MMMLWMLCSFLRSCSNGVVERVRPLVRSCCVVREAVGVGCKNPNRRAKVCFRSPQFKCCARGGIPYRHNIILVSILAQQFWSRGGDDNGVDDL